MSRPTLHSDCTIAPSHITVTQSSYRPILSCLVLSSYHPVPSSPVIILYLPPVTRSVPLFTSYFPVSHTVLSRPLQIPVLYRSVQLPSCPCQLTLSRCFFFSCRPVPSCTVNRHVLLQSRPSQIWSTPIPALSGYRPVLPCPVTVLPVL